MTHEIGKEWNEKILPAILSFRSEIRKVIFFLHFFVNRKSRKKIARKTIGIKKKYEHRESKFQFKQRRNIVSSDGRQFSRKRI